MALIPKIKTKQSENSIDLEIEQGKFKIYFIEKYATLQLMGDILVGLFFISGAILSFWEATTTFSRAAYLIGSFSFAIRPVLKILKRTWIYNNNDMKKNVSSRK